MDTLLLNINKRHSSVRKRRSYKRYRPISYVKRTHRYRENPDYRRQKSKPSILVRAREKYLQWREKRREKHEQDEVTRARDDILRREAEDKTHKMHQKDAQERIKEIEKEYKNRNKVE